MLQDKKTRPDVAKHTERAYSTDTNSIAFWRANVKHNMAEWDDEIYVCPICGEELGWGDDVYTDRHGDVIGCEACVDIRSAQYVLKEVEPYDLV